MKKELISRNFRIALPEEHKFCKKCTNAMTVRMHLYAFAKKGIFKKRYFAIFKCLVCDFKVKIPMEGLVTEEM